MVLLPSRRPMVMPRVEGADRAAAMKLVARVAAMAAGNLDKWVVRN